MKIFFITNTIGDSGGSEIITRDLLRELISQGHELFIFTTCNYSLPKAHTHSIPTLGHHAFHKFEAPFFMRRALSLARFFNPDIIHSHSNSLMAFIGNYISKRLKKPHIYSVEVISPNRASLHGKTIYFFEKLLIPRMPLAAVTTWAENTAQILRKWKPNTRIEIIPAAVNLSKYNLSASGAKIKQKFGSHLITSLKNLAGVNTAGLKEIIDAMPFVKEKHPEYRYIVFGSGDGKRELEEYVKQKNLEDFVLLPGPVSPEECNEVWAATEISPHAFSFDITIAISLLEYMAFGVACIATDVGNMRNLLKDCGVVVPKNNPRALAKAINSLIENPSLRKKLASNARKKVLEEFDVRKVASNLSNLYKEVLK